MSRISTLPAIAAADADGSELVPAVKNGITMRAAISDIVAPAAQPFVSAAQDAAAGAAAIMHYFPTLGEAIAETAPGDLFTTVDTAVVLKDGETPNLDGRLRSCMRTGIAPYYEHLGNAADPANRGEVDSLSATSSVLVGKTSMTLRPSDLSATFSLQDAINTADLVVLHDPEEQGFGIGETLELPTNRPVTVMSYPRGRASIRADAAMQSVLHLGEAGLAIGGGLQGIALDCNDLSQQGFIMERGKAWIIDDIDVTGFLDTGMTLGKAGATGAYCYEHQIGRLRIDGGIAKAQAGTHPRYGLRLLEGATDNKVWAPVASYVWDEGIYVHGGNNTIMAAHVYGRVNTAFVSNGEAEFIGCFADSPSVAYYRIIGERTSILGGKCFGNKTALGYNENAVAFSLDTEHTLTVIGVRLRQLGYDFVQKPSDNSTVFGNIYQAVSNVSRFRNWAGYSMRTSGSTGAAFRAGAPAGYRAGVIMHDDADRSLWRVGKDGSQMTGINNAGEDLDFDSYDDTGTFLKTVLSLERSGAVRMLGTWNAPLVIGTIRLWSYAGALYLKNGSNPTSETNGTIIGQGT